MARYDFQHSDAFSRDAEIPTVFDDLIRPNLGRAFPLPVEGHGNDDRFRLLLDALAQRSGSH